MEGGLLRDLARTLKAGMPDLQRRLEAATSGSGSADLGALLALNDLVHGSQRLLVALVKGGPSAAKEEASRSGLAIAPAPAPAPAQQQQQQQEQAPSPPAPPALRPICLGPLRLLLRQLRPTQPLLLCSTATPSTTLTLAAPGAGRAAVLQRRQRRPRLRRHPTPSTCSIDRSAESNPARRALVGRLCSCAWVWVWTCVCQGQWAPRERRVAPRAMQDGRRFHFTRSKLTKPAKP